MANYRAYYEMRVIGKGTRKISKTFRAVDDDGARERTKEIRGTLHAQLRKENGQYIGKNVECLHLIEERPIEILLT